MSTKIVKQGKNDGFEILGSGNTWKLEKGSTAGSSSGDGIHEGSQLKNNRILVDGTAIGTGEYNAAVFSEGKNAQVEISKSGSLEGNYGLRVEGSHAVATNWGSIETGDKAVIMDNDGGTFVNHGEILSSGGYGFYSYSASNLSFLNDGKIISLEGIHFDGDRLKATFRDDSLVESSGVAVVSTGSEIGEVAHITNHGVITNTGSGGLIKSIEGGAGNDIIRNTGALTGSVELGEGDDRFDGRGGRVVSGMVYGGKGDDIFISGDHYTTFHENIDSGNDTLIAHVNYSLDEGNYIENLMVGGKGDFSIMGNSHANKLFGNEGDNTLVGGGGDDYIQGGAGMDDLFGGNGADIFAFKQNSGRDVIHDFADGVDHITTGTFGDIKNLEDLLANHVKQVGDDVVLSGHGTRLTIENFNIANLTAEDFIF